MRRWAGLIPKSGRVLDLACGPGRNARFLAALDYQVEAVDRDKEALESLGGIVGIHARVADLENAPWPYAPREFCGIIVCNYLHRPLFPYLLDSLVIGGILIYQTFAAGNEYYGRPVNPDFLLKPGELLETVRGKLAVIAYEEGLVFEPKAAVIQRICAARAGSV